MAHDACYAPRPPGPSWPVYSYPPLCLWRRDHHIPIPSFYVHISTTTYMPTVIIPTVCSPGVRVLAPPAVPCSILSVSRSPCQHTCLHGAERSYISFLFLTPMRQFAVPSSHIHLRRPGRPCTNSKIAAGRTSETHLWETSV